MALNKHTLYNYACKCLQIEINKIIFIQIFIETFFQTFAVPIFGPLFLFHLIY